MKKTKLVALLLAVSMALTACGNDGEHRKLVYLPVQRLRIGWQ